MKETRSQLFLGAVAEEFARCAPSHVTIPRAASHLALDSVARVSQVVTIDMSRQPDRGRRRAPRMLASIFAGVDPVMRR